LECAGSAGRWGKGGEVVYFIPVKPDAFECAGESTHSLRNVCLRYVFGVSMVVSNNILFYV